MQTSTLDAITPSHPNPVRPDAHRRGRVQEGVAIGLAIVVLVTTFVVAALTVAGGTVPTASRTESTANGTLATGPDDQCETTIPIAVVADGVEVSDRVCSFGQ